MNTGLSDRPLSAILCADWGKESSKRAVYVADVSARIVRRVRSDAWSVAGVLAEARRWTSNGAVLGTFDAPLGLPESYLRAWSRQRGIEPTATFLDLLALVGEMPSYFDASRSARDWSLEHPFFSVPAGVGGLESYLDVSAHFGVDMYRKIDRMTRAKTVFIKAGVPGSVGSAATALWQELSSELTASRTFKIWPFEGDIQTLLRSTPIVVGEIYPRAAYATALLDRPPSSRPPLNVGKTNETVRREAIAMLRTARWVNEHAVELQDLGDAQASEDDFDACMTAVALLRCILEDEPLCPADLHAPEFEGGMLGTGSVKLGMAAQTFPPQRPAGRLVQTIPNVPRVGEGGRLLVPLVTEESRKANRIFRCPIAGCDKVFLGSRGGWDAHVGSRRLHPEWHPELEVAHDRKRRFEAEFPEFFR